MEEVPEHYISELSIETNLTAISIATTIASAVAAPASSAGFSIKITVESAPGKTVAMGTADASGDGIAVVALRIPNPQLWSPDSPFLYNLTVTLLNTEPRAGKVHGDNENPVDKVLS
jgi:beta-galactosidase/beta-glucuronidase